MPIEVGSAYITLAGDLTQLEKDIDEAEKRLGSIDLSQLQGTMDALSQSLSESITKPFDVADESMQQFKDAATDTSSTGLEIMRAALDETAYAAGDLSNSSTEAMQQVYELGEAAQISGQNIEQSFNDVNQSFDNVSLKLVGIGTALTTAGALGLKFGQSMAASAANEEAIAVRLKATVTSTGASWDTASEKIGEYSESLGKLGFSDDQVATAVERLTSITGDYQKSLTQMPVIVEFARAKSMDLSQAAFIVGRALDGNVGILKRYGVTLKDGATAQDAMNALQTKFAGQAEAFMGTYRGVQADLSVQIDKLKSDLGTMLIPIAERMTAAFTELIKKFNELPASTKETIVTVAGIATAVAAVAGPVMVLIGAWGKLSQVMTVVGTFSKVASALNLPTSALGTLSGAAVQATRAVVATGTGSAVAAPGIAAAGASAAGAATGFGALLLAALPIVAAVGAIAGAIYLVKRATDEQTKANQSAKASFETQRASIMSSSETATEYARRVFEAGQATGQYSKTLGEGAASASVYGESQDALKQTLGALSAEFSSHNSKINVAMASMNKFGESEVIVGKEALIAGHDISATFIPHVESAYKAVDKSTEQYQKAMQDLKSAANEGYGSLVQVSKSYYSTIASNESSRQLSELQSEENYHRQRAQLVKSGNTKAVTELDKQHNIEKIQAQRQYKIQQIMLENSYQNELKAAKAAFGQKLIMWLTENAIKTGMDSTTARQLIETVAKTTGAEVDTEAKATMDLIALWSTQSAGVAGVANQYVKSTEDILKTIEVSSKAKGDVAKGNVVDWDKMWEELPELPDLDPQMDAMVSATQSATTTMSSVLSDISSAVDSALEAFQNASGIRIPAKWREAMHNIAEAAKVGVEEMYAAYNGVSGMVENAQKISNAASLVFQLMTDAMQAFQLVKVQRDWSVTRDQIAALVNQIKLAMTETLTAIGDIDEDTQKRYARITSSANSVAGMFQAIASIWQVTSIRIGTAQVKAVKYMDAFVSLLKAIEQFFYDVPDIEQTLNAFDDVIDKIVRMTRQAERISEYFEAMGSVFDSLARSVPIITASAVRPYFEALIQLVQTTDEAISYLKVRLRTEEAPELSDDTIQWLQALTTSAEQIKTFITATTEVFEATKNEVESISQLAIRPFLEAAIGLVYSTNLAVETLRMEYQQSEPAELSDEAQEWLTNLTRSLSPLTEMIGAVLNAASSATVRIPEGQHAIIGFVQKAVQLVRETNDAFFLLNMEALGSATQPFPKLNEQLSKWLTEVSASLRVVTDAINAVASALNAQDQRIETPRNSLDKWMNSISLFITEANDAVQNLERDLMQQTDNPDVGLPRLALRFVDWLNSVVSDAKPLLDALKTFADIFTVLSNDIPVARYGLERWFEAWRDLITQLETYMADLEEYNLPLPVLSEKSEDWLEDMYAGANPLLDFLKTTSDIFKIMSERLGESRTPVSQFFDRLAKLFNDVEIQINNVMYASYAFEPLDPLAQRMLEDVTKSGTALLNFLKTSRDIFSALSERLPDQEIQIADVFLRLNGIFNSFNVYLGQAAAEVSMCEAAIPRLDQAAQNILEDLVAAMEPVTKFINGTIGLIKAMSEDVPETSDTDTKIRQMMSRLDRIFGAFNAYADMLATAEAEHILAGPRLSDAADNMLDTLNLAMTPVNVFVQGVLNLMQGVEQASNMVTVNVNYQAAFERMFGAVRDTLSAINIYVQNLQSALHGAELPDLSEDARVWINHLNAAMTPINSFITAVQNISTALEKNLPDLDAMPVTLGLYMMRAMTIIAIVNSFVDGLKTELEGTTALPDLSDDSEAWVQSLTKAMSAVGGMLQTVHAVSEALGATLPGVGTDLALKMSDYFVRAVAIMDAVNGLVRDMHAALLEGEKMPDLSEDAKQWLEQVNKALSPVSSVVNAVVGISDSLSKDLPDPKTTLDTILSKVQEWLSTLQTAMSDSSWQTILDALTDEGVKRIQAIATAVQAMSQIISGAMESTDKLRVYRGGVLTANLQQFKTDLWTLITELKSIQDDFIKEGIVIESAFTSGVQSLVQMASSALNLLGNLGTSTFHVSQSKIAEFGLRLKQLLQQLQSSLQYLSADDLTRLKALGEGISPALGSLGTAMTVLLAIPTFKPPDEASIQKFVASVSKLVSEMAKIEISEADEASIAAIAPVLGSVGNMAATFISVFKDMKDVPGNVSELIAHMKTLIGELMEWLVWQMGQHPDWAGVSDWATDIGDGIHTLVDAVNSMRDITPVSFDATAFFSPLDAMISGAESRIDELGGEGGLADQIEAAIARLQAALAALGGSGGGTGQSNSGGGGTIGTRQGGGYIPATGPYTLHAGEYVVPQQAAGMFMGVSQMANAGGAMGASFMAMMVRSLNLYMPQLDDALSMISDRMIPHSPISSGPLAGWNPYASSGPGIVVPPRPHPEPPDTPAPPGYHWVWDKLIWAWRLVPDVSPVHPPITRNSNDNVSRPVTIVAAPAISIEISGPVSATSKRDIANLKDAISSGIKDQMPMIVSEVSKTVTAQAKQRERYGYVT